MTPEFPQSHIWLDIPANCRIEAEFVSDDETRFVFGDPRRDGHTVEFKREALVRFCSLARELLMEAFSHDVRAADPLVSDPAA